MSAVRETLSKSSNQSAFEHYLRTGERLEWELKFNPYHDPENGRFTFAPGLSGAGTAAQRTRGADVTTTERRSIPVPTRHSVPRPTEDRGPSRPLNAAHVRAVMPNAGRRADEFTDPINKAMAYYGINSPEQRAAFLAQVAVESGHLQKLDEDLRYTAEGLHRIFPDRFPTVEFARSYVGRPERIANRAYAGKNGNGNEVSGDGYKFRGRGILQITGRANYRDLGFENDPDAVLQPYPAAFAAAGYWKMRRLNERTLGELNRRQFDSVVGRVNAAGLAGDLRWAAYRRALAALRASEPGR